MGVIVSGKANPTGFKINGMGLSSQTRNYKEEISELENEVSAGMLSGYIFSVSLFFCPLFFANFLILRNWVWFCGSMLFLAGLIISFIISRRCSVYQWHSCEHKVIRLLESRAELNLENLKKMSQLTPHCGSRFSRFIFIGWGVLYFCIFYPFLFSHLLCLISLIVCLISLIFWTLVLALRGHAIVQFVVTARPTESQLQETLRVGKEFKSKLKNRRKKWNSLTVRLGLKDL